MSEQTEELMNQANQAHEEIKKFMFESSNIAKERRNPNRRRGKVQGLSKNDLKRLAFVKK